MDSTNVINVLLKIGLAFLLGGLVGFQRERADRPAGFRTHVLVAVGAAVFTLISTSTLGNGHNQDPSRIASQVVIGIGFIGAGAIINQGDIILGLTTAASLWATAAVGMAAGAGYYLIAAITTVFIYLTLSIFKVVEKKVSHGLEHGALYIELIGGKEQLEAIETLLQNSDVRSKTFDLNKTKELSEYRFYVELPVSLRANELIDNILKIEGVQKARWEGMLIGRSM